MKAKLKKLIAKLAKIIATNDAIIRKLEADSDSFIEWMKNTSIHAGFDSKSIKSLTREQVLYYYLIKKAMLGSVDDIFVVYASMEGMINTPAKLASDVLSLEAYMDGAVRHDQELTQLNDLESVNFVLRKRKQTLDNRLIEVEAMGEAGVKDFAEVTQ